MGAGVAAAVPEPGAGRPGALAPCQCAQDGSGAQHTQRDDVGVGPRGAHRQGEPGGRGREEGGAPKWCAHASRPEGLRSAKRNVSRGAICKVQQSGAWPMLFLSVRTRCVPCLPPSLLPPPQVRDMPQAVRNHVGTVLLQLTLRELFDWHFMQVRSGVMGLWVAASSSSPGQGPIGFSLGSFLSRLLLQLMWFCTAGNCTVCTSRADRPQLGQLPV